MTTDLVTYYGQTDLINQLVDYYGAHLEKLDRETKLLLRVTFLIYVSLLDRLARFWRKIASDCSKN
jgi:hypothetical protein